MIISKENLNYYQYRRSPNTKTFTKIAYLKPVTKFCYLGMHFLKWWINHHKSKNWNKWDDQSVFWKTERTIKESSSTAAAAAAAAKSLQSCPTLCDPIDGSPPGSPVPGILQARTLEWVAISFSNAWKWKVKVKSVSGFLLLATPWTAAYQAPPPIGFSRQEY